MGIAYPIGYTNMNYLKYLYPAFPTQVYVKAVCSICGKTWEIN